MAVKRGRRSMPDTYFALVRAFPLVRIRDDRHLAEAHRVILDLMDKGEALDRGEAEYLDVLADLVVAYESEHVPIPDAPASDVLRMLLDANGLTQARLSKEVGIAQSTISAVLNGTRRATPEQAAALGRRFNLSPAAFLPH